MLLNNLTNAGGINICKGSKTTTQLKQKPEKKGHKCAPLPEISCMTSDKILKDIIPAPCSLLVACNNSCRYQVRFSIFMSSCFLICKTAVLPSPLNIPVLFHSDLGLNTRGGQGKDWYFKCHCTFLSPVLLLKCHSFAQGSREWGKHLHSLGKNQEITPEGTAGAVFRSNEWGVRSMTF